ncbi:MAG: hypothetical protein QOI64_2658 [Solirubrobacteraceae bacterium]|nr:hypothetical protein [Solirubrobacteraceae bacterium]
MSAPPQERILYVGAGPDAVCGQLHAPAGTPQPTGVLIVSPWGWDDVAAHRSLRAWAQHLARAGHWTLRFDLPACGDSGGSPSDPALLEAWTGAIAAAADRLRAESGCGRIATLGLGLGGLLAGKAVADGARIEDLVLWAAPVRGRAFVRQQRGFSELQSSRITLSGEPAPSGLPEGWIEAGGFVLAAATIAALEDVDLRALALGSLQRALLLERDGAAVDARLRAQLETAGVDVTVGAGDGWEAMVFHPEQPKPPQEVFERVASWLARAPRSAAQPADRPPVAGAGAGGRAEIVLDVDGTRVRESPLSVPWQSGRLVGVLAEPLDTPIAGLCAVFLNAGAVRRVGPNRMWVEAARRWAACGVPALRIDLEGIGDSDGDADGFRDVTQFYAPRFVDQVGAVLDALDRRGVGGRFVLTGLCSGGYWAFQAALRDTRVSAALLVNAGALVWDDDLVTQRAARKMGRLHQLDWWRKIMRGGVTAAQMRAVARAYAHTTLVRHAPVKTGVERDLDRLRDAATRLVLAFTGDEALHAELQEEGILARLDRWPNVALERLPARDHTLRPIVAQRAVRDLLDRQLALEIARLRDGGGSCPVAPGVSPSAAPRLRRSSVA